MEEKQGHEITSPTQWINGTFIISCLEIWWSWTVSGLSTISPCFFTYVDLYIIWNSMRKCCPCWFYIYSQALAMNLTAICVCHLVTHTGVVLSLDWSTMAHENALLVFDSFFCRSLIKNGMWYSLGLLECPWFCVSALRVIINSACFASVMWIPQLHACSPSLLLSLLLFCFYCSTDRGCLWQNWISDSF